MFICFLPAWLLGPDEQKLLEAAMAYVSGNPIMTDDEFDQLKLRLKVCSCYPPVNHLLVGVYLENITGHSHQRQHSKNESESLEFSTSIEIKQRAQT